MTKERSIQVYRLLLKAIDRNITRHNANTQWRRFAIEEFRKNAILSEHNKLDNLVDTAQDYAFLIDSIREHKELLESYNIGIDIKDREKGMQQRAAAHVGLQIPERYKEKDDD
jgi:hypothetical protein